ncbi:MAG: hypothetical protein LQ351_000143 [Letrouitia transgressa]|nr:MAG: hypothetical protein LQ351_000143 [Letrouitia transgressa]
MTFEVASLWKAPDLNPVNLRARSIPLLNPLNTHGRVLLFSWWGFFVAFWSWYAFPPLLTETIKGDLKLSKSDVSRSNIVSIVATLIVRLGAGSACDRFGPRNTFAALLLVGAIPTALAPTITTASGLVALRFFIGILGGTFVPCQAWITGFYDKNVVGAATAIVAGVGNAGGGITYFLMPAIFESLVRRQHLTEHVAWRVTFAVPFILLTVTAFVMLLTCPDTPTGKWSSRALDTKRRIEARDTYFSTLKDPKVNASHFESCTLSEDNIQLGTARSQRPGSGTSVHEQDMLDAASWELVEKPTYFGTANAVLSLPTLTLIVAYLCTFGTELCVNSILGAYYAKNFPNLGQTGSGNWAAMFNLLNIIFRPAGGMVSDAIYRSTGSLWAKKILMHSLAVTLGVFLLVVGLENPHDKATMMGLMTAVAFCEEASNGAVFSLVAHVHPRSNGITLPYQYLALTLVDYCN